MSSRPPIGARVELVVDVDRYPHFVAPAGSVGEVVDIGDPNIYAVRLDEPLAGAEDWSNEVHWILDTGDDPSGAVRALEPEPDRYGRPPWRVENGPADYVNRDALRAASSDDLADIVAGGGPTALVDAARAELDGRRYGPRAEDDATDRAYEIASADVVLALTRDDAETIADGLDLLRDIATGQDDADPYYIGTLAHLAHRIRVELEAGS